MINIEQLIEIGFQKIWNNNTYFYPVMEHTYKNGKTVVMYGILKDEDGYYKFKCIDPKQKKIVFRIIESLTCNTIDELKHQIAKYSKELNHA